MARKITVLRGVRSRGYSADDLTVTLDARDTVGRITRAVAEHHREAIEAGQEPSGGSQKALGPKERQRANKGKRNSQRGMGSEGRFPKSIQGTSRGDALKGEGDVAAAAFFDDWQERERRRGVEYLEIDGKVDEVVDKVLERDLRRKGLTD